MSTVLVVEDSYSQRECISHQLRWSGLNAIEASDGVEALEQIQRNSPDLVLLDIVMPRIDGYHVCHLLKTNPDTKNIPVVFLTCKPPHLALEWGIKYAEAYIGKPWHPKELLATIKRVLENAKNFSHQSTSDAWTEYGILNLNLIKLYECRADVWTKYGLQVTKFYEYALAAFEQALIVDPHHYQAAKYRNNLQKQWATLLEKLAQTKACQVCKYYHGRDGINCALYPFGPKQEHCRDWEFN